VNPLAALFDNRRTIADAIRAILAKKPVEPEPSHIEADLRGMPRTKSRGEAKGSRRWDQITGITLHQTAVDFGLNPERLLNVPVHGATLHDGAIVLLHDPTSIVWHGNGLNRRDIGIEVSCRAAGIEGDPRTLWLPKKLAHLKGAERLHHATEASDIQIIATRRLVQYYCELVAENGGRIQYIHAHRQAHASRVSDPGSRIWKGVGVWAQEELALEAGPPRFKLGTGKPLPDAWTGEPNGVRYNWQVDGRVK